LGLDITQDRFEEAAFARFSERLGSSLEVLRELLERPRFGEGEPTLGAELELSLVDAAGQPLLLNMAVLRQSADPRLTFELDRFNLECNLRYTSMRGRPFAALQLEFDDVLAEVTRAAAAGGARPALFGILPTLRERHLQPDAMSDSPRYRALSAGLRRLRSEPFHLRIHGEDPLDLHCDDVTFEGAATSLQVHLRVSPADFSNVYNAIQLTTAPVLAAAGNSPLLLGHRLWEETRIALFKQAVDDRDEVTPGSERRPPRVGFGIDWVSDGVFELFEESVSLHEPLLPVLSNEDPTQRLRQGALPRLEEMRLHQGTVWRWNRAIYDPDAGGHFRIEMRALPSGPTIADMLANAAFHIGLALALASEMPEWVRGMPFETAHWNFYRAAQLGLDAELRWPDAPGAAPRARPARELVAELLPLARRGLARAGLDAEDYEPRLAIIEARAHSGRTGAHWQKTVLERLRTAGHEAQADERMVRRYLELSAEGAPVHLWPVAIG
jgi:hypothetical protein